MKIIIPGNPISINQLYRGRRFLTRDGIAIKMANAMEARNQYRGKPLTGKLQVNVIFTFADNRRHDIDNCIKALFDSLSGILFEDDSQIYDLHVHKQIMKNVPRVELSVWEI